MARLVVKNGCHIYKRSSKIGLRAHNIESILGSIVNTVGRVSLCSQFKVRGNPHFASYKVCMSTLILKFEMTILVTCNC
jgi:hypothetical protein